MSWYRVVPDPAWETVYIVAGGPSLVGFDLTRLEGRTVLVVNDSVRHLPSAQAVFSCDRNWAAHRVDTLLAFSGEKYLAVGYETSHPNIRNLVRSRAQGLSRDPSAVCVCSSGYGALNLAFLKGARTIFLLGYDYRDPGKHWHGERGVSPSRAAGLALWAHQYETTVVPLREAGVQVWNANPLSAVNAFPKISLSEI
jgi:hypothetical protein